MAPLGRGSRRSSAASRGAIRLLATRLLVLATLVLATLVLTTGCGDDDAGPEDAQILDVSFDVTVADGSAEDAPELDAPTVECMEGAACEVPGGPCFVGAWLCVGVEPECAVTGRAPRATACGDAMACDGDGSCLACGGEAEPCCGDACDEGLLCGAEGSCTPCDEGAACRLATPCRVGVQRCAGAAACEDSAQAAEATPCVADCGDSSCACDGAGACMPCGASGERCCGTACDAGSTCNLDTLRCFECVAGSACDTGDPCRRGVTSCASGEPECIDLGLQDRGVGCGDGVACDGDGACVACGGLDQPCCGAMCGSGLGCESVVVSCFECEQGMSCVSENRCRTGALDCASGEAQCLESASVARATSCGTDQACDGSGLCADCGALGESCCGTMCDGDAACDTDTGLCIACVADEPCTAPSGCRSGTRVCGTGESSCTLTTTLAAGTSCGMGMACDALGGCRACGSEGMPCCDGVCTEGACNPSTGHCASCPDGMTLVPGGAFQMGAPPEDAAAGDEERPARSSFRLPERTWGWGTRLGGGPARLTRVGEGLGQTLRKKTTRTRGPKPGTDFGRGYSVSTR